MHKANVYIVTHIYPGVTNFAGVMPLNDGHAKKLAQSLLQDSWAYLYSATLTIIEMAQAIESGGFTWATVKGYYATFYVIRGILAIRARSVFHATRTPWTLMARPGEFPQKGKGNTHEMVSAYFRDCFSGDWLLSQNIESVDPIRWLREKREQANYKTARFAEPHCPAHFERIKELEFRKAVAAYLAPSNDYLAFDPEHAILAFPVKALGRAVAELRASQASIFRQEEAAWLKSQCCDRSGPIAALAELFKDGGKNQ